VRIEVTVTILRTGAVGNVFAEDVSAFPDLAACLSRQVRAWRFPRSSGDTKTRLSFYFTSER
jgi:hypothetical protein